MSTHRVSITRRFPGAPSFRRGAYHVDIYSTAQDGGAVFTWDGDNELRRNGPRFNDVEDWNGVFPTLAAAVDAAAAFTGWKIWEVTDPTRSDEYRTTYTATPAEPPKLAHEYCSVRQVGGTRGPGLAEAAARP